MMIQKGKTRVTVKADPIHPVGRVDVHYYR